MQRGGRRLARPLAALAGAGAGAVGPPGSGKSHLAQVFAARSGGTLRRSAALTTAAVPALLGEASAAIVDDADRAAAEPLLHLYNLLAERGGHLLVAAREPPARWALALADLRSRLVAAPAVAVARAGRSADRAPC